MSAIERAICPDIYHPAVARDGLLRRVRIPGGILNLQQCHAIVAVSAALGGSMQITNRANLQLRGMGEEIAPWCLTTLTACGLAAQNTAIDGIRNIMISPIAGIDPDELVNVLPLAAAWEQYLLAHPELGVLSNKFSVGFDGSGSVSILDRPNDITLRAASSDEFAVHLALGELGDAPIDVGVRVKTAECISLIGAIASSYVQGIATFGTATSKKLRLRQVIAAWGLKRFLQVVATAWGNQLQLGGNMPTARAAFQCRHLGVWAQPQRGLNYFGIAVRLGRITGEQIGGLAAIAQQYGSSTIRLTPWQNAILPDINDRDVAIVKRLVADLQLGYPQIDGLLAACAGATGCQFAATDTQADASALAKYLQSLATPVETTLTEQPLNLHLSGCDKSCAQHYQADIAMWGTHPPTGAAGYRLCVGGGDTKFGRELSDYLTPIDVRLAIDRLIRAYQERRNHQESFRAFTDRQSLAQLQQVLHAI